jgi:cytochrome c-type biogenesis protein CcmH
MIGFWIMAVLLLLAAYALFAPALLGKHRAAAIDRRRLNLMLHRQRRDELVAESAGSELAGLQAELDKDLLGDLSAGAASADTTPHQGRAALLVALIAAPLLGLLVYSMLGRLDLANFRAEPVAAAKKDAAPEFQEMIDRLAERLKTNDKDVGGWMLLGRSYVQIEQYDKAVDTFAHALKLAPDNIDLKAAYAEALGESLGGEFTGEPAKIAAEVLAVNPKQRNALWLAGAGAAQSGDTPGAIAYLERLRAEFPKDSPDDKHLGEIIAELKGGGKGEQAEAATPTAATELPATGEQKSIKVQVGLAAALKSKAGPDDVVFIFAKAASGPPMPLAIVRKKVKDLPVEVTLDDSMAMVQGMNLSAFDQLIIGARISKTGQALPKPGDLQGLTKPTAIQNSGRYAVEISEELK